MIDFKAKLRDAWQAVLAFPHNNPVACVVILVALLMVIIGAAR